jgi:GNAT superfamily N-acetyltransferase
MPSATTTQLTYRPATAEDAAAIAALVQSAYRGESSRKGWTTEADLLSSERINAAGVLDKIQAAPNGTIILAHDEQGKLASCCELLLRRDDDTTSSLAYFGLFSVDPERQAGGIGRQVLAEAERYAKKTWGVGRIEMQVMWMREELISWYVRRGYKKTEETREFLHAGFAN